MSSALLLTPECQTLWLISPKVLLLYDRVVMDQRDLSSVLNPMKDTLFAAMKARAAERLSSWGFLDGIDYSQYVTDFRRTKIREIAEETVGRSLPGERQATDQSKFYELTVFTHQAYGAYLEDTIMACPMRDEEELAKYVTRRAAVEKRLRRVSTMDLDDQL